MTNSPSPAVEPADRPSREPATLPLASAGAEPELHLLLEWTSTRRSRLWRVSLALSAALHVLFFLVYQAIPASVFEQPGNVVELKTPLYFPTNRITQKAPNRSKVSTHFDLNDLLAARAAAPQLSAPPPGQIRKLEIPSRKPDLQTRAVPKISAAPPLIAANVPGPSPEGAPDGIIPPQPPPPAPSSNPIDTSGIAQTAKQRVLTPPKNSLSDVIQTMARNSNSAQLTVSDDGSSISMPISPGQKAMPGHMGSTIELQSDPQGADFRPYLIQILSIVRRNWFSVLPESARMRTLRGRTVIQFEVNRDGSIPKLVITGPAGLAPLDRAAVAGLSMSNPLPPLPRDFKGAMVTLQFVFTYNMPSL